MPQPPFPLLASLEEGLRQRRSRLRAEAREWAPERAARQAVVQARERAVEFESPALAEAQEAGLSGVASRLAGVKQAVEREPARFLAGAVEQGMRARCFGRAACR